VFPVFEEVPFIPDYWDFGLRPLSGILKNTKEHNVSEIDPVAETLCSFVFFRIPKDGQSPKTQ
jgi:hypothetical protein